MCGYETKAQARESAAHSQVALMDYGQPLFCLALFPYRGSGHSVVIFLR
jgi:hypothetical protein